MAEKLHKLTIYFYLFSIFLSLVQTISLLIISLLLSFLLSYFLLFNLISTFLSKERLNIIRLKCHHQSLAPKLFIHDGVMNKTAMHVGYPNQTSYFLFLW